MHRIIVTLAVVGIWVAVGLRLLPSRYDAMPAEPAARGAALAPPDTAGYELRLAFGEALFRPPPSRSPSMARGRGGEPVPAARQAARGTGREPARPPEPPDWTALSYRGYVQADGRVPTALVTVGSLGRTLRVGDRFGVFRLDRIDQDSISVTHVPSTTSLRLGIQL